MKDKDVLIVFVLELICFWTYGGTVGTGEAPGSSEAVTGFSRPPSPGPSSHSFGRSRCYSFPSGSLCQKFSFHLDSWFSFFGEGYPHHPLPQPLLLPSLFQHSLLAVEDVMVKSLIKIVWRKGQHEVLLLQKCFWIPSSPGTSASGHCGLSLLRGKIADTMADLQGYWQLNIMGNLMIKHLILHVKKVKALKALVRSLTHRLFWWWWWGAGIWGSPVSTQCPFSGHCASSERTYILVVWLILIWQYCGFPQIRVQETKTASRQVW